ncbi:effector-associated constant component EACC1 [Amycolatopsis lexingtonensis]|uniref:effector-associated constant component EACC1 n=1 Tax=Amycolatopsis lexingtonensis TaxID=218822 RepID=UPI003F6F851B
MDIAVSVNDPALEESLLDWLRGDPELRPAVKKRYAAPKPGELGTIADAIMISVGSGGALTVLASALKAWVQRPRGKHVVLRVSRGDRVAEIDAERVDSGDIEAILDRVFREGESA